jgi:hypothetical protein
MDVLATMEQVVSDALGRFNRSLPIIRSFERFVLENSIVVLEHLYFRRVIDKVPNCAHDFLIITAARSAPISVLRRVQSGSARSL